jgi:hypothetical protein
MLRAHHSHFFSIRAMAFPRLSTASTALALLLVAFMSPGIEASFSTSRHLYPRRMLGDESPLPVLPPDSVAFSDGGFSPDGTSYHVTLASARATGFEIGCLTDVNVVFGNSLQTDVTISGLSPLTNYSCEARGVDNATSSIGPWTSFSFETPDDTPGPATVISVQKWKTAASFRLSNHLVKTFAMTCNDVSAVVSPVSWGAPGSFDASFQDISAGMDYSCAVRAIGLSGTKGPETSVEFSTPSADAVLPSNVTVLDVTEHSNSATIRTTISLDATSYDATCYSLTIPMKVVSSKKISVDGSSVSVDVSDLPTNAAYACEIFGINEAGEGPHAVVEFATSSGSPPPVRINSMIVSTKAATMYATRPIGASSYDFVCWSPSLDPAFLAPQIVWRDDVSTCVEFSVSNLAPDTIYQCRITSIDAQNRRGGVVYTDYFVTKA